MHFLEFADSKIGSGYSQNSNDDREMPGLLLEFKDVLVSPTGTLYSHLHFSGGQTGLIGELSEHFRKSQVNILIFVRAEVNDDSEKAF